MTENKLEGHIWNGVAYGINDGQHDLEIHDGENLVATVKKTGPKFPAEMGRIEITMATDADWDKAHLLAAAPSLLAEVEKLRDALQVAFIALGRAGGNCIPDPKEEITLGNFAKVKIREAWEKASAALASAKEVKP